MNNYIQFLITIFKQLSLEIRSLLKRFSTSVNLLYWYNRALPVLRITLVTGLTLALPLFFFMMFVFATPVLQQTFTGHSPVKLMVLDSADDISQKAIADKTRELATLNRRLDALTPRQAYLVVNTSDNHFYLYNNRNLIREGFISSGSYVRLLSHDDREWLFRTPKGKHTVKGKIAKPVWRKPDWAFIEDGLPVPPLNHHSRFEAGVLGDYALSLGDGYLIHGTLYKRFLGMPVTHGCIRLNDEDLEAIYKTLQVGSRVYIY